MRLALPRATVVAVICAAAGYAANAQTPNSIDSLLKRIQALEKRVDDLEKKGVAFGSGGDASNSPTGASSGGAGGRGKTDPLVPPARPGGPLTGQVTRVQAPFEVVDRAGRPIVQIVQAEADASGGLYVLNQSGNHAVLIGTRTSNGGGVMVVRDGTGQNSKIGALISTTDGSALMLQNAGGEDAILVDGRKSTMSIFNNDHHAVVELQAGVTGQFRLKDEVGTTMVEAGTLKEGMGVVRVGPRMGGAVGLQGLPWAIMGKK